MTEFREYTIVANGINQRVLEAGSGHPVILCHGFPELAYSWRHQLRALEEAGYRGIAPDMRGYGGTDAPLHVEDYSILHLVGDMVALLDILAIERASIVGHDWGAPVAWAAAQLRPDRFVRVMGMSVPFAPRGPASSLEAMRRAGLDDFYQLYFQRPGRAEADLEIDIAAMIRRMMWTLSAGPMSSWNGMIGPEGALEAFAEPEHSLGWLSDEDISVYVAAFERSGLVGPLNWYRNIDRNWVLTAAFQGRLISQPAWFISGEKDPIYPLVKPLIEALPTTVPGLLGKSIIPNAGHWIQQEASAEVNTILLDFLAGSDLQL